MFNFRYSIYRTLLLLCCYVFMFLLSVGKSQRNDLLQVKVGVVLSTNLTLANMSIEAINMSLFDFYNTHSTFKTRIVLDIRDATQTVLGAAAAALYLIKKKEVVAIIGPGTSMQAPFLINLGNQTQVPIITFSATSPLLDALRSPYFIRATHDDSSQVLAICSIIKSFKWREVVAIYVDNEFGEGILPYLVDSFQGINARIRHRSAISLHSSDDQIKKELYKLMTMSTRIFIVHMLPDLGSRVFAIAKEIGMMKKGYAWIVTNGIADLMSLMEESSLEAMEGVLGIKTYFPRSKELLYLQNRWRKRFNEELNNFQCWAYDAATALALSVNEISNINMSFDQINTSRNLNTTDLDDLGLSISGPKLLEALSRVNFNGVAGRFQLKQGKVELPTFKIINIDDNEERTVGFWRSELGLVKKLKDYKTKNVTISQNSHRLRQITWPGDTIEVPKGWEIPTNSKKLRILVPKKDGFEVFVKVTEDGDTNTPVVTGFCIDLFDAVMKQMPYAVPYEYIPFTSSGSYDEMVYKVFLGEFDGAVGDTTILANRSSYVDFTLPYSESGVVFVVPVKDEKEKGPWVFSKPLKGWLWFAIAIAFFYIGFMVWIFEYQESEDFRNKEILDQISNVFYFSFSTLFFSHRKPSESACTRTLVVVWCFVVLILTQSYTATLSSMLTIQQLRPVMKHMEEIKKSGVNIGYQRGSFTFELLKKLGFEESRLKSYNTIQEMHNLFLNKNTKDGIGAVFDEVAYVKIFRARYCSEYTIIEPAFKADGFGFAFPLGSPLVSDISRQILNLTEGETMRAIENKWFVAEKYCMDSTTADSTIQLDLHSFQALFLIVFLVSLCLLFCMLFLKRYRQIQTGHGSPIDGPPDVNGPLNVDGPSDSTGPPNVNGSPDGVGRPNNGPPGDVRRPGNGQPSGDGPPNDIELIRNGPPGTDGPSGDEPSVGDGPSAGDGPTGVVVVPDIEHYIVKVNGPEESPLRGEQRSQRREKSSRQNSNDKLRNRRGSFHSLQAV